MNCRSFGAEGERIARHYLEAQGYTIRAMNNRSPVGEIDVIAQQRDTIVFVEVKRRTTRRFGSPAEAVTPAKQARILRAAKLYLQRQGLWEAPVRFDVIAITPEGIRHIEAAFDATGHCE